MGFKPNWLFIGPLFVIIGAGLWGYRNVFRVNLNTRFDSEVLVFHEHLFCILFTLPFAFFSFSKVKKVSRKGMELSYFKWSGGKCHRNGFLYFKSQGFKSFGG